VHSRRDNACRYVDPLEKFMSAALDDVVDEKDGINEKIQSQTLKSMGAGCQNAVRVCAMVTSPHGEYIAIVGMRYPSTAADRSALAYERGTSLPDD
jgi:hypothetical protein